MNLITFFLKLSSKVFLITSVPQTSWSAQEEEFFRPKLKTLLPLCIGLFIFGLGESILVVSDNGVTPWTVLAEGFAKKIDIGIGFSTFIISVLVLLLWIPLKLRPGIGTIMNILIIAMTMGGAIPYLYFLNSIFHPLFLSFLGTFLVGLGSGIYLISNLGPGTRDGLMTGISKKFSKPISLVRFSIELIVVLIGWTLGGTLGVGTIIFAIFIGPFVSISLKLVSFIHK
jgi:uncharacterized membrane protein YczE